jgi:hypothetical protein
MSARGREIRIRRNFQHLRNLRLLTFDERNSYPVTRLNYAELN